jgi:hypothetical protein
LRPRARRVGRAGCFNSRLREYWDRELATARHQPSSATALGGAKSASGLEKARHPAANIGDTAVKDGRFVLNRSGESIRQPAARSFEFAKLAKDDEIASREDLTTQRLAGADHAGGVEATGNRSAAEVLVDRIRRAGDDVAQEACFVWASHRFISPLHNSRNSDASSRPACDKIRQQGLNDEIGGLADSGNSFHSCDGHVLPPCWISNTVGALRYRRGRGAPVGAKGDLLRWIRMRSPSRCTRDRLDCAGALTKF